MWYIMRGLGECIILAWCCVGRSCQELECVIPMMASTSTPQNALDRVSAGVIVRVRPDETRNSEEPERQNANITDGVTPAALIETRCI
jgi:hypothetical protein